MRTKTALIVLACCAAAAPAVAQSLGLGKSAQQGPAQASRQQASRPSTEHPDINQGRFVAIGGEFGTLRTACSQCHQVDGSSDPSGAFPRLTGQSAWYLYSTLRDFADGKRKSDVMDPIAKEMSDSQMQDVAAYYATRPQVPYPAQLTKNERAVAQGQAIAKNAANQGAPACDSCHGVQGLGNPPLYPYLAGQFASYLEDQLRAYKSGARQDDPMGVMRSIAKRLSEQQISDVAMYYASLQPKKVTPSGLQPGGANTIRQSTRPSSPQEQAETNAASNDEDVEHVGATPSPKPQTGTSVVPREAPMTPQKQQQRLH